MGSFGVIQMISATLAQCILQGIFIPLLVIFLGSRREKNICFKGYITFVNLLCFTQTIVQILRLFDMVNKTKRQPLLDLDAVITAILCASVQAFYIFRCWRFFRRRFLPLIPFLFLWLTALVSGLVLVTLPGFSDWHGRADVCLAIWVYSSFVLDLIMTTTTIVYLYRAHSSCSERVGIFSTVWQVLWASAVPPLLFMIPPMIDRFVPLAPSGMATTIPVCFSGKAFVLSLMLSIAGRGYMRQKFDEAAKSTSNTSERVSAPVFVHGGSNAYDAQTSSGHMSPQGSAFLQAPNQFELSSRCERGSHKDLKLVASMSSGSSVTQTTHHVRFD